MRRPIAPPALVLALLLAAASPCAAAQFSLPAEREVRLSGRVVDADSGAGIPGATIRTPTAVGVTRYDGAFTLDFRARASVEVLFEREGYYPEPVGVAKGGGVALNVRMKQRMATLYGIVTGCSYDGRKHAWDDMSSMRVEVSGKALSGQLVNVALNPLPDGGFMVLNLPVGDYVVSAGGKSAEVRVRRAGEELSVALTHRWCMRKEFHPDVDATREPAAAMAKERPRGAARPAGGGPGSASATAPAGKPGRGDVK